MAQEEQNLSCNEDALTSAISLYQNENSGVKWKTIERVLVEEGLDLEKDPRIKNLFSRLSQIRPNECRENIQLSPFEFKELLGDDKRLVSEALLRSLVIRDFRDFCSTSNKLFENAQEICSGEIKKPGLFNVSGEEWSVSIVTTDGQKVSYGSKVPFTLDELCGPLILGLAIDLLGEEKVNGLQQEIPPNSPDCLKNQDVSHANHISWFLSDIAMILLCSAIKSAKLESLTEPLKHDYVLSYIKGLCSGEELCFSNASYNQIKETDCLSAALAHFLKAYAKTKFLHRHVDSGLDLLFQLKSMEVTTDSLAMIGSILANGGISPFTDQEILSQKAVTTLLNVLYSDGFGKLSTKFAVQCGLPGICIESGAVLLVLPGILGMGLFSPRVECRCSVRASNFILDLIKAYGFHPYTNLDKQVYFPSEGKIKKDVYFERDPLWPIFTAIALNDIKTILRYIEDGLDVLNLRDSSGLSLLHVAAANGHLELVKIIYRKAPDLLFACDSCCKKPSCYAMETNQTEVLEYLQQLERATRTSLIESAIMPTL